MIVANRIGTEQNAEEELLFRGESAIYDYSGDILAKASLEHEEVLYAMISPEKSRVKSFNSENDIFLDRRPDMYA
jgi:predicted amidohydrolase